MCCPCDEPPIQIKIQSDNDCKCNCASSCCFPFFRSKKNSKIPTQELVINQIGREVLNKPDKKHKPKKQIKKHGV